MREYTVLDNSAPNGKLEIDGDAVLRPATVTALTATYTEDGALLTYPAAENAQTYVIYKDGKCIGYASGTSYTDTAYKKGMVATYTVAGYAHGACIGAPSPAAKLETDLGVEVKLQIGNMTGYVNGEAKTLDAAPVIRNSRTMLPVRFVAENLGAEVAWDGATSTVTVTTYTAQIKIAIGYYTASVNGQNVMLDAVAFIENGRTYLPVRFIAENLGAEVVWDGTTSTATLTK